MKRITIFDHEHVHEMKKKEIIAILVFSLLISAIIGLSSWFLSPASIFLFSLLLLTLGLNMVAYFMPWFGRSGLFLLMVSFFTIFLNDLGVTGFSKVLVFLLVGLVFEFSFLYLKLHLHHLPLDLITGSILAIAVIPLGSAFILSASLALTFPEALKNLLLSSFAVGLGASVLAFLIWKKVEHTKFVMRLFYYLRR